MLTQDWIDLHPTASTCLFASFFVFMWLFVSAMISFTSGWHALAKRFRLEESFNEPTRGMESGRIGWSSYKNCLTFGVSDQGFYLAVLPLFRFQHPPLLIPWAEVRVHNVNGLIFDYKDLVLGRHEQVKLRVGRESGDELRNLAGAHWPSEK